MTTFLAITGWLTAALLALGLYSCRKNKLGWRKLYEEQRDQLRECEHKQVCAAIDAKSLEWHREEVARLTHKCEAICAQIRRMKGRGRVTCQMNPLHRF